MKRLLGNMLTASLFLSTSIFAASYIINPNEIIVGDVHYTALNSHDEVAKVAERFDIGYNEVENANPYIPLGQSLGSGTQLKISTKHLLPNQTREGIVVNLPEMRMYYFPAGTNKVLTYPIGIGKIGKTIPIAITKITRKVKDPVWVPTPDIREFNLSQGIVLPQVMPAGPDNPLGPFAIYMGIPTYLIHSTIFPESVGKRASFGCIRMYESDIKQFFPTMEKDIPVAIVNTPIKTGWQNGRLYMETHKPLEEYRHASGASVESAQQIVHHVSKQHRALVDWQLVSFLAAERDGIPHEVGVKLN